MTTTADRIAIRCAGCGKEQAVKPTAKGMARVPRGWKRHAEQIWCGACWGEQYMLRAVTFTVASPDCGWDAFRDLLREQWGLFTAASNWLLTELYVRDVKRAGQEKLPAMPNIYLYPEARQRFPAVSSQAVAALEQAVKRKYSAKRYELLWTCASSLPVHRYPAPAIVPGQGWSAAWDETGERPVVSLRLGEQRVTLRLRGGHRYRRQLAAFRQLVSGAAVQGELAIGRKRAGESKVDQGNAGGRENGARVSYDITVKLVAWLPRPPLNERSGTLIVRTDKDALLIALDVKDERIWTLNADHVRRWQAEHRRNLNRWGHDTKAEQRPVATFAERRSRAVDKHRQRLKTFIGQAAAQLAQFASRLKFAAVRYDDAEHGYCPEFPWFALRERLQTKLDEFGIGLTPASGEVAMKQAEPLAETEHESR